jgi:hypothetical protein
MMDGYYATRGVAARGVLTQLCDFVTEGLWEVFYNLNRHKLKMVFICNMNGKRFRFSCSDDNMRQTMQRFLTMLSGFGNLELIT